MAYRRSTRSRGRSYGSRRSTYRARPARTTRRRSTRRMSSRRSSARTIRIVVQTVPGSVATNQSAIAPMRAMF